MTLVLSPEDESLVLATPLFAEIDRSTVLDLLSHAAVSQHPDGGFLFAQGDVADRFFVVLDGRATLVALTEGGDQSIIEVIDKGATFAEGAIFAVGIYPLTADLVPGTRLLQIPAEPFLRSLAQRPGLTAKLLGSLARWQRRLLNEITDLKGRSPVQRLGLYLLAMAKPTEAGAEVMLPFSKNDLASRIGITPESLSRAAARLRPVGVTTRGRGFAIADPDRLRLFCGADD